MPGGDHRAQGLVAAIGVGLESRLAQGPPEEPWRGEGHEGGTGIEQLSGPAAQAPRRRIEIAAVELGHRRGLEVGTSLMDRAGSTPTAKTVRTAYPLANRCHGCIACFP